MKHVKFEIIRSPFSSWESLCQQVADFASTIEPENLINISHAADGRFTVWYWAERESNILGLSEE